MCGKLSIKMMETTELYNNLSNDIEKMNMKQDSMHVNLLSVEDQLISIKALMHISKQNEVKKDTFE